MCLDVSEIKKLEEKLTIDRKAIILEKMQFCYEYRGIEDGDVFLDYLEKNTSFAYGQVADIDKFKSVYLTNFKRLDAFNEIYLNSGADVDELLFCGFDGSLNVINQVDFYDYVYEEVISYDFSDTALNDFEAFVNKEFLKCC